MQGIHRFLSKIHVSDTTAKRIFKILTGGVYVFLYAPVLIVVILSFTEQKVPAFPMKDFSLKWYWALVPPEYDEQLVAALFDSIQIAVISAIGSGIVGTLAALGIVRGNFQRRLLSGEVLNTAFLSPIVVPWVVTGLAVLTLFSILGIQGTFVSVIIGHILITLPFVVLVVSSQLSGFDREVEEAAKNLGATEIRTFYEVTLPLILPGVVAGMLFAFTISFDNFTQTFFWVGGNIETLPIVIYGKIQTGIDPTINAIGTIIVLMSVTLAAVAEVLSSRLMN
jgi:spermidine/putrescine transport system permease protein